MTSILDQKTHPPKVKQTSKNWLTEIIVKSSLPVNAALQSWLNAYRTPLMPGHGNGHTQGTLSMHQVGPQDFFGQNLVKQNRYNQGLRKHINIYIYIYIVDLVYNIIYIYILDLVYYISIFFANAYIYIYNRERERTSNQLPVAPRILSSRTATAVIRTSVANPAGNTKPSTGWNLRDRPARHGGKFPIMRCKIQFHVGIFSWLYDG